MLVDVDLVLAFSLGPYWCGFGKLLGRLGLPQTSSSPLVLLSISRPVSLWHISISIIALSSRRQFFLNISQIVGCYPQICSFIEFCSSVDQLAAVSS